MYTFPLSLCHLQLLGITRRVRDRIHVHRCHNYKDSFTHFHIYSIVIISCSRSQKNNRKAYRSSTWLVLSYLYLGRSISLYPFWHFRGLTARIAAEHSVQVMVMSLFLLLWILYLETATNPYSTGRSPSEAFCPATSFSNYHFGFPTTTGQDRVKHLNVKLFSFHWMQAELMIKVYKKVAQLFIRQKIFKGVVRFKCFKVTKGIGNNMGF